MTATSINYPVAPEETGLVASDRMRAKFFRELDALRLPERPSTDAPIGRSELESLPSAVQRYMRFMQVEGAPRTWSLCLHMSGVFRMGPTRPWLKCEAWQYDTRLSVARIFHMRLRMGLVPFYVRDTYVRGQGRMLGRIADLIAMVDVTDEKIATGELVTYVNDAILFAPSMLLGPQTTWSRVSHDAFDVAFTDAGRTVRARVRIDARGAPVDFSTTDRFGTDPASPKTMVRARWSTPIDAWQIVGQRPTPSAARAIWHFESGDFTYADFRFGAPGAVAYDVSPAAAVHRVD